MCAPECVHNDIPLAFRKGVRHLHHSAFHSHNKMERQGTLYYKAYFFLKTTGAVKSRDLDGNGFVGGSTQVAESVM